MDGQNIKSQEYAIITVITLSGYVLWRQCSNTVLHILESKVDSRKHYEDSEQWQMIQEAQLMMTNQCNALRGQSRSPI